MDSKYYSVREAAELLGVSRGYIYHLKDTRRLKVEKIGFFLVISEEEIKRYKESRNKETEGGDKL